MEYQHMRCWNIFNITILDELQELKKKRKWQCL